MRLLPAELRLLVSIIITSASAVPHVSVRVDETLPCTGELAPLNTNGQSPGTIYDQLQQLCIGNTVDAPLCKCNLLVYNIGMANQLCQGNAMVTWPSWAQSNLCANANVTGGPPDSIPYNVGAISIPKWANQDLSSNQTFNVDAALHHTSSGWSPIQIAAPIIAAVGVALIAGTWFFFYRRRRNLGTMGRRRPQKAWTNAHLHGPRRFFGLIPDTLTVKSRDVRDPQWEIDDSNNNGLGDNEEFLPPLSLSQGGRSESRQRLREDATSMHSRTTSVTSLLPGFSSSASSSSSGRSRGLFGALASKFGALSLSKNYQSGTTKGPDYKRVQVLSSNPDRRFKIDSTGPLSPLPAETSEGGSGLGRAAVSEPVAAVQPQPQPQSQRTPPRRDSTLPSVLDIRGPSTVGGTRAGTRDTMLGPGLSDLYDPSESNEMMFASPVVAQSDYSLMTSDLVTPITPSRDAAAVPFGSRNEAFVSPGSPFLPSTRPVGLNTQPPPGNAPSRLRRNQSTDTLAYELYPRPRG